MFKRKMSAVLTAAVFLLFLAAEVWMIIEASSASAGMLGLGPEFFIPALCGLLAASVGLVYAGRRFLAGRKLYSLKKTWIILIGLMAVCQTVFIVRMTVQPSVGALSVFNEAVRMTLRSDGVISSQGHYFEYYGNNYPVVLFLRRFFILLKAAGISDYWLAAQILNMAMIDTAVILTLITVKQVFDVRYSFALLILILCHPYTYVLPVFVYTNTLSMPFMAAVLLLTCNITFQIKKENALSAAALSAVLGTVAAAGTLLRMTDLIPVIAIALAAIIYTLMNSRRVRRQLKRISLCVCLAAVFFAGAFAAGKADVSAHTDAWMRAVNFPAVHWVMMSFNENGDGTYMYSDEKFTASYKTQEQMREADSAQLELRLQDLGAAGVFSRLCSKVSIVWGDPILNMTRFCKSQIRYGILYKLVSGRRNGIFIIWAQFANLLLYIWMAAGTAGLVTAALRRKDTSAYMPGSRHRMYYMAVMLTVLGLFVFYLIWEANNYYAMGYYLFICQLAMPGMELISGLRLPEAAGRKFPLRHRNALLFAACILLSFAVCFNMLMCYPAGTSSYLINVGGRRFLECGIDGVASQGKVLRQSFSVPKGRTFNKIQLRVKNSGCEDADLSYRFRLFDDEGLLCQSDLIRSPENEGSYYSEIYLPENYGSGNYYFTVSAKPGMSDPLYFMYIDTEVTDCNPSGTLYIDGVPQKHDMAFNVLSEG